ncbi:MULTISPECIES: hypothetical protein [Vibrio]|nr:MULTISPECIES: hypothetical protein [Vibrio]
MELLVSLNSMGLSPTWIALLVVLWKQDKRLTIIETILEGKNNG